VEIKGMYETRIKNVRKWGIKWVYKL
jgi:hypothetical protein